MRVVLLRLREEVRLVARSCVDRRRRTAKPERVGRAERVDVEAVAVADAAGLRAAPAERERDRVVGLAGDDPDRGA